MVVTAVMTEIGIANKVMSAARTFMRNNTTTITTRIRPVAQRRREICKRSLDEVRGDSIVRSFASFQRWTDPHVGNISNEDRPAVARLDRYAPDGFLRGGAANTLDQLFLPARDAESGGGVLAPVP